jgi:hypothetical protein
MNKKTYDKNMQKIGTEVYTNILDMDLEVLRNFHFAFCLHMYNAFQEMTEQDLKDEFIEKHKNLSEEIIRIEKKND